MDLQHIKGIGEKTLLQFYQANIYSVEDLIRYYPYRYQILQPEILTDCMDGVNLTICATVASNAQVSYIRKNFNALRFQCDTYGKQIKVVVFNRSFLKSHLTIGKEITLTGKYVSKTNTFTASEIKLSKVEGMKIIPIYHTIKGIKNSVLEKIIGNCLNEVSSYEKELPNFIVQQHHFLSKEESLKVLHQPDSLENIEVAKERIIYEELFSFLFKVSYLKKLKEEETGIAKHFDQSVFQQWLSTLPFTCTKDQEKAIYEGLNDLQSPKRMNRLLLGDVGSGKTIVAVAYLYANYLAGYQGAFLVPTEVLATQHFYSIRKLLATTSVRIDLLIGSMTKREKENVLKKVQNGEVDLLIGTHALLNDHLFFKNLGFIVTDEQHRFGVHQRDLLKTKGVFPDMLFMSATPIPRTYALTIYGDMDTSFLKEKPKGRKEIITKVLKEKDLKEALFKVLEEIKIGHQVYVVAPMIEENEENDLKDVNLLKEKFELAFHGKVPIGVLHGKMKKQEKENVMNDFQNGLSKILISTTVIEVGVDVQNATIMMIFNAERFGLATLHQLRGRVGRNSEQSYCYLISNDEKERLKVLEESNDGFYISEKDFEFRGEGDLFGVRQSGDMTFAMANLKRDYPILMELKKDVLHFIDTKEYQNYPFYLKILERIDFTN